LLSELSNNEEFKQFIQSENRGNIQFHHIDGEYTGLIRKKAVNNKAGNIAIVSKQAHDAITNMNKGLSKEDKINNMYKLLNEFQGEVFLVSACVPGIAAQIIDKYVEPV